MLNFILFFILVLIASILLFFLRKGLFDALKKYKEQSKKIAIEDFLKQLYHLESSGKISTVEKISLATNNTIEKTNRLIQKLSELGLIQEELNTIKLTSEGQSYALRIIRVHRLWEKYLAENTSVSEYDWHYHAENKEHQLTEDEIKKLAAKLGNPLRDPHGDPIPSEVGIYPESKEIPLTELEVGNYAEIVHIEDEPIEIYSQLRAQNIQVGMQIRILEKDELRLRFEIDGEECLLAPILANNIQVMQLSSSDKVIESFEKLSSIKEDEEVTVVQLSKSLRGQQRRRLLDFGIVPGAKIKAKLKSLSGDPTAYLVRGTTIALRKNQCDHIYIKRN